MWWPTRGSYDHPVSVATFDNCSRCGRRNPISLHVEREEAFRTVVPNRWRNVCPSRFDEEAQKAGARYRFVDVSWHVLERSDGAETWRAKSG